MKECGEKLSGAVSKGEGGTEAVVGYKARFDAVGMDGWMDGHCGGGGGGIGRYLATRAEKGGKTLASHCTIRYESQFKNHSPDNMM